MFNDAINFASPKLAERYRLVPISERSAHNHLLRTSERERSYNARNVMLVTERTNEGNQRAVFGYFFALEDVIKVMLFRQYDNVRKNRN